MVSISILNLWNTWNIRCFVILSLLFQLFLILFAPLRKKIANNYITSLLWLTYLMADWVATFAIGLISHHQGNSSALGTEVNVNGAIHAFWVPFLLLHLGGPDTITALSLEDNSLWQRHLLTFIFQASAAIYVFVQVFPSDKSLVIPTILVFLVGVIRNVERILALNFSSLPTLRKSMNPSLSESNWSSWDGKLTFDCDSQRKGKLLESTVAKHGYYFFQIFNVFLADLIFREKQRQKSVNYFSKVSPLDALRIISVELQFMYELLHTKALLIHSRISCIFRFIALIFLVVAFILFHHLNKHQLPELDVKITYLLLSGGIALDVIALVMLVFSDWTTGKMWNHISPRKQNSILLKLASTILHKLASTTDRWRKTQFAKCKADPEASDTYEILDTSFIFRRWSESISACNLFSELWGESPRKMYKCNQGKVITAFSNICSFPFHMAEKTISFFHQAREIIDHWLRNPSLVFHTKYVSKNPFINELWIFIFNEVKYKSVQWEKPNNAMKIFEARGDMVLKRVGCRNLLEYVDQANFDSNILCWHIATEFWFNKEKSTERNERREFSKILSDYMFYLLVNQSNVMFAVTGNAQIMAREALEILRSTFEGTDVKNRWMDLFENPSKIKSLRRGTSNPVFQGLRLAKDMEGLGENKWAVMSEVWVEMMTYAATHIRGEVHAQVLSKGGELLTFVWLLMAHFGCFYQHPWGMVSRPLKLHDKLWVEK